MYFSLKNVKWSISQENGIFVNIALNDVIIPEKFGKFIFTWYAVRTSELNLRVAGIAVPFRSSSAYTSLSKSSFY